MAWWFSLCEGGGRFEGRRVCGEWGFYARKLLNFTIAVVYFLGILCFGCDSFFLLSLS